MGKMKREKSDTRTPGPLPTGRKGGLGQHFLKNNEVVDAIVGKAAIRSTDIVLEIGCGTGVMTKRLLEQGKKVNVVEIDPRMIAEVMKLVQGTPSEKKLSIIHGDALKVELPFFDVCCANIPYQISSALVFRLLAHRPFFRCAVIMFQEEFAQRLTAKPGDEFWCRLSVNCQLLAHVTQLLKVGKGNFRPPPKVESRVVRIEPINPPPPINFVEWDGLIKLCFNRRNKTLASIFGQKKLCKVLEDNFVTYSSLNNIPLPSPMPDFVEKINQILVEGKFNELRSAKMTIEQFMELLNAFNTNGIHFVS